MQNILVAINFEKNAERLVEKAYELASTFGAKVWLLHVTEPDPEDYISLEAGPQFVLDKRIERRKKEAQLVHQLADRLRSRNVRAEGLLIEGPTAKTIRRKTAELNIDLVIAGHQKKNFFYQLFVGNTDQSIIDELNVPVLVVPLPKRGED